MLSLVRKYVLTQEKIFCFQREVDLLLEQTDIFLWIETYTLLLIGKQSLSLPLGRDPRLIQKDNLSRQEANRLLHNDRDRSLTKSRVFIQEQYPL